MQSGNVLGHRGQQGVPFRSGQVRRFLQGFDLPFAWELVELARYVAYQQASANAVRPGFFGEDDFRIVGEFETGCHAVSFIVGRWDLFRRTSRVESASSELAALVVLAVRLNRRDCLLNVAPTAGRAAISEQASPTVDAGTQIDRVGNGRSLH